MGFVRTFFFFLFFFFFFTFSFLSRDGELAYRFWIPFAMLIFSFFWGPYPLNISDYRCHCNYARSFVGVV